SIATMIAPILHTILFRIATKNKKAMKKLGINDQTFVAELDISPENFKQIQEDTAWNLGIINQLQILCKFVNEFYNPALVIEYKNSKVRRKSSGSKWNIFASKK